MSKAKLFMCCLAAIALTGCSKTPKESEDNAAEQQDTTVVSTSVVEVVEDDNNTNHEAQPVETVISDDLDNTPRTYTVDGKNIKVVKDVTTEDDLQQHLGEPYIALPSSYTYIWKQGSIEYKTKFYLKSGVVTGVKESKTK